jgi:hypothetical protein
MQNQKKTVDVEITKDDGAKETVGIFVVRHTNATIKNADRYKARTWNQCITEGVITKKELGKLMRDRGIWDEDKDQEEKAIIQELQDLERKLFLGGGDKKRKLSEGQNIAISMRRLRAKLRELIGERISLEENTAEALADNAKFDYFVADCTFYANGQKVYKDVEDYNQKSSDQIAFAAAGALAEMMYQVDTKFEEGLPENKFLKKFNLVNDELSLVNKDGVLVDVNGKKINEFGYYVDDQDRRTDKDGNLLNEDGTYVIQLEYEDDLHQVEDSSKETKKKKKVVEQSETT